MNNIFTITFKLTYSLSQNCELFELKKTLIEHTCMQCVSTQQFNLQ